MDPAAAIAAEPRPTGAALAAPVAAHWLQNPTQPTHPGDTLTSPDEARWNDLKRRMAVCIAQLERGEESEPSGEPEPDDPL